MESLKLLPGVPSAPATADDAYKNFLAIGDAYFTGGAEPRADGRGHVEAWPALLGFVQAHREALQARGVVEAELVAGSRLCRELAEALGELQAACPLPACMNRPVVMSAIAKLERMRAAVRRMGRGYDGQRLLAQFGTSVPLDPSQPAQVAEAISQFLAGASENLERLHLFRFVGADIEELKAHRRALLGLCADTGREGEPASARADRLLSALQALYASLGTAISQAFPAQDPRRSEGLGHIPRATERRQLTAKRPYPERS